MTNALRIFAIWVLTRIVVGAARKTVDGSVSDFYHLGRLLGGLLGEEGEDSPSYGRGIALMQHAIQQLLRLPDSGLGG
jgi:hypothetical protein